MTSTPTPDFGIVTVRTSYFKGKPHTTERRVTETFKPTDSYNERILHLTSSPVVKDTVSVHYKFTNEPAKKLKLIIVEYVTEKKLDNSSQ